MRYRRQIVVDRDPASTFRYLADFENAAEWDPGIVSARRLSTGPTTVGSRFEVTTRFRGNQQVFDYVVTAFEDGRRIALTGDGDKAKSDDVITVEDAGGRSRVTYEADVGLKGVYRLVEPFLRSTFRRMADDALDGLQTKLGALG